MKGLWYEEKGAQRKRGTRKVWWQVKYYATDEAYETRDITYEPGMIGRYDDQRNRNFLCNTTLNETLITALTHCLPPSQSVTPSDTQSLQLPPYSPVMYSAPVTHASPTRSMQDPIGTLCFQLSMRWGFPWTRLPQVQPTWLQR